MELNMSEAEAMEVVGDGNGDRNVQESAVSDSGSGGRVGHDSDVMSLVILQFGLN